MNGKQRIQAALRGKPADRVPVMLHNFLIATREAGITQRQYREDPAKIAAAFIQAVETYDYDGVVVDVDTATLAGAVGLPVDFPDDDPARCESGCLPELAAVRDLPPPDIAADPRVQVWLEAARILKQHFGDQVWIRGNCDQAPFSLASMLRSPASWMMDLLDEDQRDDVDRLLAHAAGKPYLLHICGNTTRILDDMLATGADVLESDCKTDVRAACETFKNRAVFCGNLDPSGVLAHGTPELVATKTRELLAVFAGNPRFILNAGCAIPPTTPPTTPPANLRAMLRAAREG